MLTMLCALFGTSTADAQRPPPVEVEVRGVFGEGLDIAGYPLPVLVRLRNRTERPLRGEVEVEVGSWRGAPDRHRLRVDLPPRSRRRVQLSVHIGGSGTNVMARFLVEGRALGEGSLAAGYHNAARGIALLTEGSRLRGSLLDLRAEESRVYGGRRHMDVPVGEVDFDPETSDPILPTRAIGWSSVRLLVASAPLLERLSPTQADALSDWLRAGGAALVYPRTAGDLRGELLTSWVGPLTLASEPPPELALRPNAALPPGHQKALRSASPGARVVEESFGCSAPLGFGHVFVASYDGTTAASVDSGAPRRNVVSLLERPRRAGVDAPLFAFGATGDGGRRWASRREHQYLRAALDPNESYRPALLLVALVLLLYVVAVGPLNFRWVARRNRPILALLTTPLLALGCLFVLLAVGYIGKGTSMRYRSVALLELLEGERTGPERRHLGLFLTRPTSFDMVMPERGATILLLGDQGMRPVFWHDEMPPRLAGLQGGLWETLFLREDRVRDVGGSVTFEREGSALRAVRNESELALRGAFIVDGAGAIYPVGDVDAGASAAVSGTARFSVAPSGRILWGPDDPELHRLAALLGLHEEIDRDALYGLTRSLAEDLVAAVPTLFARIEQEGGPIASGFAPETEVRFVRIVPWVPQRSRLRGAVPENAPASDDAPGSPGLPDAPASPSATVGDAPAPSSPGETAP